MAKTYSENRILAVYWDGLQEFRADLRAYGATVPRLLVQASQDAAELGASRVREAATGLGGVAAHVAPSIKAGATARSAYVALGGPAYPEAAGAEFGSYHDLPRQTAVRGVVHGWNQFADWRGSGPDAGYFVEPALRASEQDFLNLYSHLVFDEIERYVFPE